LAEFALHSSLLRLPYFWDEAGYYIPAARDLLLSGSLIPHTTVSNAHPPLVMAYLALAWKLAGYTPLVTRTAMLLVAAFTLLGVFRLASAVANREVAWAAMACTAMYPVFFAQSSLGHVDLAAAGLTFWALTAYVKDNRWTAVLWFSAAVLAKETAILAPLALFGWEVVGGILSRRERRQKVCLFPFGRKSPLLLTPAVVLVLWYSYHYARTGYVFGNPEFFRYNVEDTLNPLRVAITLIMRLWQVFGYMNLFVLTFAGAAAMWLPALHDDDRDRPRISFAVQFAFLAVVLAYVLAMAFVGGAVLARYMLPVVPLVMIVLVSTLWRRVRFWRMVIALVIVGFVIGLVVNPPYGFPPEDNLAYRDYIVLHQQAENFLEARFPMGRVLTAWPASDEITRTYLGYVTRPMRVVRIEDFSAEQVMSAAEQSSSFDVALVFSTKYEPAHPLLQGWQLWQQLKTQFFGYHRDVPPAAAAQILGGRIVYSDERNGQWVAVIEMERAYEAKAQRAIR
jgi:nitrate reductase NapE component